MLPSVTWHTAVETKEDESLPWMGAAQARYWSDYYLVSLNLTVTPHTKRFPDYMKTGLYEDKLYGVI